MPEEEKSKQEYERLEQAAITTDTHEEFMAYYAELDRLWEKLTPEEQWNILTHQMDE